MLGATFNPAFLSDEDLIEGYTVRSVDLDLLVETVRDNSDASANQHVLVVGPRGIGKTTLVLRVAAEVRRDPELSQHWFPLVFSEESYEVTSAGELWLEALYHLGRVTQQERWYAIYRELKQELDEQRLYDRALARLMDFAHENNKRLLVVIENLNVLLGEQVKKDDAWTLRHTLQNERRIMLLATATSRFEDVDNVDRAMYDLFREHALSSLDADACRRLWQARTGEFLAGSRVRGLQILAAGNPRLLTILSSFAAGSSLRTLMDDLVGLVDQYTDYFCSNLEALPVVERKVFVTLADLWRPATAREVGDAARMHVSITSSLLKRLVGRGAVVETHRVGRRHYYQVTERLYNIYHLMRRGGLTGSPVRFVVDFMCALYDSDGLIDMAELIAQEASLLDPEERMVHFAAYAQLLSRLQNEASRGSQTTKTVPPSFEHADVPLELHDAGARIEGGALLDEGNRVAPASKLVEIAMILQAYQRDPDWVVDELRRVLGEDNRYGLGWAILGAVLATAGNLEEAEAALGRALTLDGGDATNLMAASGFVLIDMVRARAELRRALKQRSAGDDPTFVPLVARLQQLLGELPSRVGAVTPSHSNGYGSELLRAWSFTKLMQWDEALAQLQVVLLNPQQVHAGLSTVIAVVVHSAANGHAERALEILQKSPSAQLVAPLLAAINRDLGRAARVPQEVSEIADDILAQIAVLRSVRPS